MVQKRGQVTLFVIIAIIIVALVLLFFFIYREKINIPRAEPKQITETRAIVGSVIQNSTYDALYMIGRQGGYINLPVNSLITEKQEIAYALYFGKSNLPPLNFIQKEISDYINKTLVFYANNYNLNSTNSSINFSRFDFDKINVQTTIQDDDILISLSLPTSIQGKNGETFSIDSYTISVPLRFGYVYRVATEITERKLKKQAVDESYFKNKDLSIDVLPIDTSRVIYSLKIPDDVNNKTFIFNVAMFENG